MAIEEPGSAARAVGAVDKAVEVLLLFGRSFSPALGVTEIATALDMPKSGVHRVLATLRRHRLVSYDQGSRRYSLGQAAISLSQSYIARMDVQALSAGLLSGLMRQTAETATLAVRRRDSVIYRAQALPDRELRVQLRLARPTPLHAGATGKAFLAHLGEPETQEYLTRVPLQALTIRTLTDPAELRRELAAVRGDGFATSEGERLDGVASVAAAALDHGGYPVAVVAVSGPSSRMDGRIRELAPAVLAGAAELAGMLGRDQE